MSLSIETHKKIENSPTVGGLNDCGGNSGEKKGGGSELNTSLRTGDEFRAEYLNEKNTEASRIGNLIDSSRTYYPKEGNMETSFKEANELKGESSTTEMKPNGNAVFDET